MILCVLLNHHFCFRPVIESQAELKVGFGVNLVCYLLWRTGTLQVIMMQRITNQPDNVKT